MHPAVIFRSEKSKSGVTMKIIDRSAKGLRGAARYRMSMVNSGFMSGIIGISPVMLAVAEANRFSGDYGLQRVIRAGKGRQVMRETTSKAKTPCATLPAFL